ncbi:LolA family protein [Ancylobacter pratisalsi]|uniref:Outer-membrane lipoprotein carrier protein LolA n=1 Tax=Ancylobacter pratisalsi TaxID=1745854 RepID=A0A6P1YMC1_9HYPH|nr:outer-membrane lipoprotein carrier protein LolA [Ancylobacter pratisalsi]QIB34110.1 outer-membrane lipoprotein carrier protein LolA [Ancylobacter pratisalsi]
MRHLLTACAVLLCTLGAANVPAGAQVPPPPFAPPKKPSAAVMAQSAPARSQAPATLAPGQDPNIQMATVAGQGAAASTIDRINQYFNSFKAMSGNFVQVDPDGTRRQGQFYLLKPGRVLFEYDPPSPIVLVADGRSVAVRDKRLKTQDITPLSATPLRFLLSENFNLARNSNVTGVYQDDVFATVVIEEKQPMVGTFRLMIMFDAKTMQLKQWTVTDPQGYDTTVAVSNLNTTDRPDPMLFVINRD